MNSPHQEIEAVIRAELAEALRSKREGKQGRARVCARRAAGWAVGWHKEASGLAKSHINALEQLRWLANQPDAGSRLQEAAARLITKLAPDGSLPFEQDPIEDARKIITALLGIDIELA